MKIKEVMHQKVAVLTLRGNLMGPPETQELYEDVKDLLAEGVTRIALDLVHVRWINSLGVGAIMKCLTAVSEAKGHLRLVGLTEKVRSVFLITQLIKIFTIHETTEEAVEELNAL